MSDILSMLHIYHEPRRAVSRAIYHRARYAYDAGRRMLLEVDEDIFRLWAFSNICSG